MQSTRQHILDYLQTHRTATAGEMSRAFSMTAANLRHHLGVLKKQGLVEVVGRNPPDGRGRPTQVYMLTRQAQARNLNSLASVLIEEFLESGTARKRQVHLRGLAGRLGGTTRGSSQGSITQRLVNAVRRLNQLGYRARWEAHADTPRVILGQCPYVAIIDKYPILCHMDAHLLEDLLDTPVEQTAKLEHNPQGPPHCIFLLQSLKRKE